MRTAATMPLSSPPLPMRPRPALRLSLSFLPLLAILCGLSTALSAWSASGHRIIGAAAAEFLTPEARAGIEELLGKKTIARSAVWADHIRGKRPETYSYHYINLPLGTEKYDPSMEKPGEPSIVVATEKFLAAMVDPSLPLGEREDALKFALHFIGDLHQPLHCASNNDSGGNGTQVRLFGKAMNLHHVWDFEIIDISGLNDKQFAEVLRDKVRSLSPAERTAIEKGSVADWVLETHRLAPAAYQLPDNRHLDLAYLNAHQPTVEMQLIRATVRLALVLNRAFGPKR